ncbi:MAG: hypothetical protein GY745_11755 [Actinomycetia bacterium]|nr:hypothetical protein [Actinomycetes bacterium]
MRPIPDWLVREPYHDVDLRVLKTGKEAQINLIERSVHGASCMVARERYLPREVKQKGTLEAMSVQGASTFLNDVEYREGRQLRKTRDRRSVERRTTYGKRLLQDRWTGHEHDIMHRLWAAGLSVPYPSSGAAPQLQAACLRGSALSSAYNLLWWDGRLWFTRRGLEVDPEEVFEDLMAKL